MTGGGLSEGIAAVELSEAERDMLADALRQQWGSSAYRPWDELSEHSRDRWREEVDYLPVERIVAAHVAVQWCGGTGTAGSGRTAEQ